MGLLGGSGVGGGLIRFASGIASVAPSTFDFEVTTTAAAQTYSWNIASGTGINASTDWGDGTTTNHTTGGTYTNTYANAGTYTVKIGISSITGATISFRPNPDRTRLTKLLTAFPAWTGVTNISNGFSGCSGITGSIPTDLLRYVTNVTTLSSFFSGCTGLTGSIPTDLLRYVTNVTTLSSFLNGCTGLTGSIPTDLLRYVTNVTTLLGFLSGCTGFTGSIPVDFLRYVTNATTLSTMFFGCTKIQAQPDIFGPDASATRFLNKSINFTSAFRNMGTIAGTPQGTAPEIWNFSYGTGTPTTTTCFSGNSATNLSNWASIPIAWGGPA